MRIVLLGGGLSHVVFVRDFAQKLPQAAEIVLVHTEPQVFFSPSFPSVLSGAMPLADGFIDLRNLCTLMGVTFIQADVKQIDLQEKIVRLKNRASIQYDFLSLNGLEEPDYLDSSSATDKVIQASDHGHFFSKLKEIHDHLKKTRPLQYSIGVVGGGATGIMVAQHCQTLLKPFTHKLCVEIFEKEKQLVPRHPSAIRRALEKELKTQDILFHTETKINSAKNILSGGFSGGENFKADLLILANGCRLPDWLKNSGLIFSSEGFLETHKTGVLLSAPQVSADGWLIGAEESLVRSKVYGQSLMMRIHPRDQEEVVIMPEVRSRQDWFLARQSLWSVQWGVLRKSEKALHEQLQQMKEELEHLRAIKEQKHIQLDPLLEDQGLFENLKRRLKLDLNEELIEELFLDSIMGGCRVNAWVEKEYKDVFNDHYQSGYYTIVDLLEKAYLQHARPEYLRLQMAAPTQAKDVEILSQIIVGVTRAAKDIVPIRIHMCGAAMNAVQITMGVMNLREAKYKPQKRAYIALARPLGLYGLLSQQANSESIGQWLSQAREQLHPAYDKLLELSPTMQEHSVSFPLTEYGFMNDVISYMGQDGWRVCVNLSQLPRWEGVDHIMKQHPQDVLINRNWKKGFKFWPGQGETLPESQYLLWEPHVARPSACFLIDPEIAVEMDRELQEKFSIQLHFVGYVEAVHAREQTHFKLSDWQLESVSEDPFVGITL
ncbi:MAG: FAD-dependent oxidoreductase [Bdellovibrionaceae bacterium]|nr:FAD-dependent oxidoreductase [Pseudobdellovibrionaceae bacterium]